jgi:hypothetical protein
MNVFQRSVSIFFRSAVIAGKLRRLKGADSSTDARKMNEWGEEGSVDNKKPQRRTGLLMRKRKEVQR